MTTDHLHRRGLRIASAFQTWLNFKLLERRVPNAAEFLSTETRKQFRDAFAPEIRRTKALRDYVALVRQRVTLGQCYVGTSGFCCDTGSFSEVRGSGLRDAIRTYRLWNGDEYMSDGPSSAWVASPERDGEHYSQAPYGWGIN